MEPTRRNRVKQLRSSPIRRERPPKPPNLDLLIGIGIGEIKDALKRLNDLLGKIRKAV